MTQHQSALSTLIGEVLTDPGLAHSDVFRRMLQAGLQELIAAEAAAKVGAARYERTEERTTRRNGTRPRTSAPRAGELELTIPKLRAGSFYPSLLNPAPSCRQGPLRGDLHRLAKETATPLHGT